jgi:hypothetical protein
VDLVMDCDPVTVDFWHYGFPTFSWRVGSAVSF